MKTVGVIPARYQSSRFPGKPLALIAGKTLIERVWRQASGSRQLDDLVIATDDKRILECARSFGARVVMTSPSCACGTDRLAEVARRSEKNASAFINIQGDEPLLSPSLIDRLVLTLKKNPGIPAVTAAFPLKDEGEISNHNVVKVVTDERKCALYFSRCPIPFERTEGTGAWFKHLGIYGYRRSFLLRYASWPPTALERTESLEQLRILEKGYQIKVVLSQHDSFGVDTPSDVRKIEKLLKSRPGGAQ